MGDYGIKIGANALTDSDLNLQFSSEFSSLKFYKWDNAQFTTNSSGEGSVEIAHDLSYTPTVLVFKKTTAVYPFLSATTYPNAFTPIGRGLVNSYDLSSIGIEFFVDDEKITIKTLAIGSPISGGVEPNTTYYFRYYILVDLSQVFSDHSNIDLTGDFGFKISKPGKNVLTAEEYDMCYSSKYKALQYYANHIKESSLTLPAMWASPYDDEAEGATYVDFNHNLGYPPFFLAYADISYGEEVINKLGEIPYIKVGGAYNQAAYEEISGFSDSSRVRILFKRHSYIPSLGPDDTGAFAAKTINIKVIMFAENLLGAESP